METPVGQMLYKVTLLITPKKGVLDIQGKAVLSVLRGPQLGHTEVEDVRIGKMITFITPALSPEDLRERVKRACREELVNPNVEQYTCTIEQV